ncbi:MAG: hypothetical protein GY729_09860 [Desulfobacteraceae bacterium]|nr:hypothetical protein [Desulfobacteraceae bacterium]
MTYANEKLFITKEAAMDRLIYHWMSKEPSFCLWGIIELTTSLDDDLIEKTLGILIENVPILSAKLHMGLWNGYWGHTDPGDIRQLITRKTVSDDKQARQIKNECVKNPIDPLASPLIRVISIDGPHKHYLILQVHHLAVDGEGCKQLFNLFAYIYRNLTSNQNWQPDITIDANRSWRQLSAYLKWHQLLMMPVHTFRELFKGLYTMTGFSKTSSRICPKLQDQNRNTLPDEPAMESISLTPKEIDIIKTELQTYSATVNDYLMAALMTTVNHWNKKKTTPFSKVLSGYTIDGRRWLGQPKGTMANMSATHYLVAGISELMDIQTALKAVKPKLDKAKKYLGLRETWDMVSIRMQPELISRTIAFLLPVLMNKMHALTNIGIIPDSAGDFGSAKAVDYSINAPVVPGCCVLFTATSYKNKLTLHVNFNNNYIKKQHIQEFMTLFQTNLTSLKPNTQSHHQIP